MTKTEELCEFLAWVQDNYTEIRDDSFCSIDQPVGLVTREELVSHYLAEKGVKDGS